MINDTVGDIVRDSKANIIIPNVTDDASRRLTVGKGYLSLEGLSN